MTKKPGDISDPASSGESGPRPKGAGEATSPSPLDPESAKTRVADQPEKLFGLFAQALFSAPSTSASNVPPESLTGAEPGRMRSQKPKALLVGFSDAELTSLRSVAGNLNLDTIVVPDANRALERLTVEPVTLLIVDWDAAATQAPVLAQATRKMQIERPFIIGLATQLNEALKLSAKETGLDQLSEKPLTQEVLAAYLKQKGGAFP